MKADSHGTEFLDTILAQKVLFPNIPSTFAPYLNTNPVFVRPGRRRFLNVRERNPPNSFRFPFRPNQSPTFNTLCPLKSRSWLAAHETGQQ